MSLLLEALKKAEAAKQQGADAAGGKLSLEPVTPSPAEDAERPLMTRDRLPDITQPLEILSDDLPSAAPASVDPPPLRGPAGARARAERAAERAGSADVAAPRGNADAREAARQVFEAKSADYDPYRFIKVVVGVAVGVVLAYGGYVYYQLQPRSSMVVNTSPAPAATATATPAPPAAPTPPVAIASAQPAAPAPVAPATPTAVAQAPATPAPEPAPAPAPASPPTTPRTAINPVAAAPQATRPITPRPAPAARPMASAPGPASTASQAAVERPASSMPVAARADSPVERGYALFEAGNLAGARQEYQRALSADPRSRDALLGLAAIDLKTQNYGAAAARYERILEIDPRDPYAQAGLLSLRGQADPVQSESRIKNLLAAQPDANFLNFTLGNQYAAQSRWNEAQAAYFKAFTTDPDNPDYAFNLAVSLDHLGQPKLAREYYQKALALASARPAGFDSAKVEARVRQLAQ